MSPKEKKEAAPGEQDVTATAPCEGGPAETPDEAPVRRCLHCGRMNAARKSPYGRWVFCCPCYTGG